MSGEQLSALLAKLKEDAGLREKLQGSADLDAAVSLAKEAGFDVSREDWLKHQATRSELSDEELEGVVGGKAEATTPQRCGDDSTTTPEKCPGGRVEARYCGAYTTYNMK